MWTETLITLREILSSYYFTSVTARNLAQEAGLSTGSIVFTGAAKDDWHNILREASHQGKVLAIAAVAAKDYPTNETLKRIAEGKNVSLTRGPDFSASLTWQSDESVDALEKVIGKQATFLDVSYLEIGVERAKSVARIVRDDGTYGTGFLIAGNLLLTNHHVLPDSTVAAKARAQFNFQRTANGLMTIHDDFELAPQDVFVTSPLYQDDWTVVRVAGEPNYQYGALQLVQVEPKVGDYVSIIQHPDGDRKQIALHHNVVAFVNERRIQYLTDTRPGSSGSPGFDNLWRVITLHHSGGWLKEPGSKNTYWRNEGIHINAVIKGLQANGIPFEQNL